MTNPIKHKLSNGLRVLVEPVDYVNSAAISLFCDVGSSSEKDDEAGITHLIEHMLFKGTKRRSAYQIAQEIEGRGGMLNAFTDKESTCYYCRVLADDVENGMDVLVDMLLNSVMDSEELAKEQGVVIEEIRRGKDDPSEYVHDLHLENRWPNHPLGKPVIGTEASVAKFTSDKLKQYVKAHYTSDRMILAIAGKMDVNKVVDWAEQKLGGITSGSPYTLPARPIGKPSITEETREIEQVHFCIGSDSVSLLDKTVHAASVLDTAFGGGMSSRLFQEVREKRGLAYAIGSYSLAYRSGGILSIYGSCSKTNWIATKKVILDEMERIKKDGLTSDELEQTKRLLKGSLVIALEAMSSRVMRMAKNELVHRRHIPVEETISKIDAVTNDDIVTLANECFVDSKLSITTIGPIHD